MLLHINPTRQRGKRTGSLARASGWYMTFFAAGVILKILFVTIRARWFTLTVIPDREIRSCRRCEAKRSLMNTARQAVDSFDMLSRAVPGGFLDLSLEAERPGSRDQTSLFRG